MKLYEKVLKELGEERIILILSENMAICPDHYYKNKQLKECTGECTECWDKCLREEIE